MDESIDDPEHDILNAAESSALLLIQLKKSFLCFDLRIQGTKRRAQISFDGSRSNKDFDKWDRREDV